MVPVVVLEVAGYTKVNHNSTRQREVMELWDIVTHAVDAECIG